MGDAIKSLGRRGIRYLDNNGIIKRIEQWLGNNIISPILERVGDITAPLVSRIKNVIRSKLDEAQEIARQLSGDADNVTGRPPVATEGAYDVSVRNETGGVRQSGEIELSPLMANKGRRLINTSREEALSELLEEARRSNINIQADEEANALLDWAARREGVNPENYHAVTIGDNIFVRPEYLENVRILREEMIHVFQQRAGQSTENIVEAEIEARLQIIRYRHRWGITNDEVREMIDEIRQMRETGRY